MEYEFGSLFAGLLFSSIGLAAFKIGKGQARPIRMGAGVLLMVLPWIIEGGLALWGVGALLTAAAVLL